MQSLVSSESNGHHMAYGIPHTIWTQAPSFLSISWHHFTSFSSRRSMPRRCGSKGTGGGAFGGRFGQPKVADKCRVNPVVDHSEASRNPLYNNRFRTNNDERVHAHADATERGSPWMRAPSRRRGRPAVVAVGSARRR